VFVFVCVSVWFFVCQSLCLCVFLYVCLCAGLSDCVSIVASQSYSVSCGERSVDSVDWFTLTELRRRANDSVTRLEKRSVATVNR
jgi:hypothetical protein